jgi:hypothetical protein
MSPGTGTGLIIDFGHIRVIYLGLTIVWFWMLYRYYAHSGSAKKSAENELLDSQLRPIQRVFRDRLIAMPIEQSKKDAKAHQKRAIGSLSDRSSRCRSGPHRVGWQRVWAQVAVELTGVSKQGSTVNLGTFEHEVTIRLWRLYWPLFLAVAPVNFRRYYFSEFWTAYAVALLPPIAAVLNFQDMIWVLFGI